MEEELIECELVNTFKLVPYLFTQCPDLYKLINDVDQNLTVRQIVAELKGRFITIKGHIQSGKTKFMICSSLLFLLAGYSVIIVLRNNKADQEQIYERLVLFEKEIQSQKSATKLKICKTSTEKIRVDKARIYLTLGNGSSTLKILDGFKDSNEKYVMFIDEVDYVDSGEGTRKNDVIPKLKENAHCVFGVSATIMDPLGKEQIFPNDIILLSLSPHYKGITSIQVCEIDEELKHVYTTKTGDDLFENDGGLKKFVRTFSIQKPFVFADGFTHPNICLVNICRTKDPTINAQQKLARKYPEMFIIVFNGDGITYAYKNETVEYVGTISSLLQTVKNTNTFPNILIFSGDLAGRGISFTSSDFKWHLTSMRLLVADQCDEPELIQRVRLCGVYNDDVPLTLYSTYSILSDLKKAYFRQEEIICALKKSKQFICRDLIESIAITKEKFTRRCPIKDKKGADFHFKKVDNETGWKMAVYKSSLLPPDQAYELYGVNVPTQEERDEYEEEYESSDEEDENMIVKEFIVNPKYIAIYESIVTYLKRFPDKWVSRGNVREACRDTIQDARELGQLQGRYSAVHENEQNVILWRKVGREYEYKL